MEFGRIALTPPPERPAPSDSIDLHETIARANTLIMLCPTCGHRQLYKVPVDLTRLVCETCTGQLDPMDWTGAMPNSGSREHTLGDGSAPVNHRLMQRLIATCYRQPDFARKVIDHYRRDRDRAKAQEWGIDKALLLVHAANAVVQRGHRSALPFVLLVLALVANLLVPSPFGLLVGLPAIVVALGLSGRNAPNHSHWRNFCRSTNYNPSVVSESNFKGIEDILHFCEATQPINVHFFSGYEPFDLLGQEDENWSLLVDRRKREGGEVEDEPASLDLEATYENIANCLLQATARPLSPLSGRITGVTGLPLTRFRVDEVVLVSGRDIAPDDRRFLDSQGTPQIQLDSESIRSLRDHSSFQYRVYKRVAYYDPVDDIGMLSFLRLAHHGPFTFIESASTRLLPVVKRLMNQYCHEPTADELAQEKRGPEWWKQLSYERRQQIRFTGGGIAAYIILLCIAGFLALSGQDSASSDSLSLPLFVAVIAWLAPLLQVSVAYGWPPKLEDDWEEKEPKWFEYLTSFGLVALHEYHPEVERRHRRERVHFAKQTREWDYSPKLKALRVWQSRTYAYTRLESTDLLLLRRTQDLVVQEAFLQCLEAAGIDTTDFRKGAALINNYGIINQRGRIEGGAQVNGKLEASQAHQGSKMSQSDGKPVTRKTEPEPKVVQMTG